jgi:hypothetical protein
MQARGPNQPGRNENHSSCEVRFHNVDFLYHETGGDGFFFGVPVDTGTVVSCDLRAIASSFGRKELASLP